MRKDQALTREKLTEELHSQIRFSRGWSDVIADLMTYYFGTVLFLTINALFFAGWIFFNLPWLGFTPFDPYPFGLLTMIVSLEAIFLSIVVLVSQNRQSKISDIRQRVEFEVDVRAEEETTKILKMLHELHTHLGIKTKAGKELKQMERRTDLEKIQRSIEEAS